MTRTRQTIPALFALLAAVTCFVGSASAQSFPQNDRLQAELRKTAVYCKNLKPRLVTLQTKASRTSTVLNITKRTADTSDKLDKRLQTNIAVLQPLTLIPNVNKITKPMKRLLKFTRNRVVKPINTKAKKADKLVAPYRKPVKYLSRGLYFTNKAFKGICTAAAAQLTVSEKTEACLKNLQSGPTKTRLSRSYEDYAKGILPVVIHINKVLKVIDEHTTTTERALKYPSAVYPDFVKFDKAILPLKLSLDYSDYVLKYIRKALDHKFTLKHAWKVKVKIKVKVWESKFKWRRVKYTFTVRQILNGIDLPFDFLEKKFMKLALKKLGPVSAFFRKLKAKLDAVKIPGWEPIRVKLARVQVEIAKLKASLPKLNAALGKIHPGFAMRLKIPASYRFGCKRCINGNYLAANGRCKRCTGNTYAKNGATKCTACPKGTTQIHQMRCVKKLANCFTHPKFNSMLNTLQRNYTHLLVKKCKCMNSWGKMSCWNKACAAGVLWHYSPVIKLNLSCQFKGGHGAFYSKVMKRF